MKVLLNFFGEGRWEIIKVVNFLVRELENVK